MSHETFRTKYGLFHDLAGEPVRRVNSSADEHWPSISRGRFAFVRGYAHRRDEDRTSTPYLYLGSRRLDDAVDYRRMPRSWQPMRPPH